MFGEFSRNVDDKNRISIPAKLRDDLGSKFYLTIGLDGVIEIRSEANFKKFTEKLNSQNNFSSNVRLLKRAWLGKSQEINLDSQGRFIIPKQFVTHAAIQKEVLLIGVGDLVELWGIEQYNKYMSALDKDAIAKAAKELAEQK